MKNYLNNWSTVGPEGLSSFCHCYCIVLRVICILYRRSNKPKSADFLLIELNHLKKISGKFKLRYSIHYEIEAGDAILICRIGGHIMWCHEKSHSKLKCCKTMWTISSLHTDLMFSSASMFHLFHGTEASVELRVLETYMTTGGWKCNLCLHIMHK